jgi:hypothetical protein
MKTCPVTIIIEHRGGLQFGANFIGWTSASTGVGKSHAELAVRGRTGIPARVTVSLSNGWCKKPADDWRLTEQCQDELLEWARENGRKIAKTPRSPGRKTGKRQPKVHPKQMGLFSLLLPVVLGGCACSFIPMSKLNVSLDFTPRQMEIVFETAEAWCEATPDACVPVSVGRGRGGYIKPTERKGVCDGVHNGGTQLSAARAPVVEVCAHLIDERELSWVVAHEMGHAFRPDKKNSHPDGASAMNPKIQEGELRFNDADVAYVEES